MKKLLFFALILGLFGCKTPAKILDTTHTITVDKTQVKTSENTVKTSDVSVVIKSESTENSTTVEEVTTVTYDTSLPVDPTTGRPPVNSESTAKKTTTTGKQIAKETATNSSTAEASTVTDNSKIDLKKTSDELHLSDPKTPKIAYYFYIILTISVLSILFFLNKKFGWITWKK